MILGAVVLVVAAVATVRFSDLVVRPSSDKVPIHDRYHHRLPGRFEVESLDGRGNNRRHPDWGQSGLAYRRVAPARYADGLAAPVAGPDVRYISNRVFNDIHQNVFSERGVTQWGFTWGQFLDHTIGKRDDKGEQADLGFNAADPLETFRNDLGVMPFNRSAAAPGTGAPGSRRPREQVNTVSSFVDAFAVYGGSPDRLEWLREGPVDGNLANNSAKLLLPGGLLPTRSSRGSGALATAPAMDVDGRLTPHPDQARVAGDTRANENIALTATQTLFAREHNRIVALLPLSLSEEQKFQIARRVVIAEEQWITYNEFLPAMGVRLPRYRGYQPWVNPTLSNEFATVGYRAHSMIHGEVEASGAASRYTPAQLAAIEAQGVEVARSEDGASVEFTVPLNVAFFNPDLVGQLGLGPLLQGIGSEREYRNDEMIDNQLRSVLFQVPATGNPGCLDGPTLPQCFQGVVDLGALDVQRGRDHGMPTYNELRRAYGLAPRRSFAAVTGERSSSFPRAAALTAGHEVDDPDSLGFVRLLDRDGRLVDPKDQDAVENDVVTAVRRTPLAARLQAIYGSVDKVDAFVGMVSEPHVPGAEMGELQLAIWRRQFQALRDGDRYFYANDPVLRQIRSLYAIDYRVTLGDVIALNTDIPRDQLPANVFLEEEAE
jgi:hypothetical protein